MFDVGSMMFHLDILVESITWTATWEFYELSSFHLFSAVPLSPQLIWHNQAWWKFARNSCVVNNNVRTKLSTANALFLYAYALRRQEILRSHNWEAASTIALHATSRPAIPNEKLLNGIRAANSRCLFCSMDERQSVILIRQSGSPGTNPE